MRLYTITLRRDNGAIHREWQTTSSLSAMGFINAFGGGFGLHSKPHAGIPIPHLMQTVTP